MIEEEEEMGYKHVEGRNKKYHSSQMTGLYKEVQDINRKFIKNNKYVHQHI